MIPRAAFSLHGNTVRYRGEDVARLTYPLTSVTDDFLHALSCLRNNDTNTLEQDITNLQTEIDFLKLEVAKALKFLVVADLLTACEILERIVPDAD